MSIEEKLMTLQTLGKLLEANYPYTKFDLDGSIKQPTVARPIMPDSERLAIQSKILELVKSIRADEAKTGIPVGIGGTAVPNMAVITENGTV